MEKIAAGRDALGAFAPKFAELDDDALFGQVWSREAQLSAVSIDIAAHLYLLSFFIWPKQDSFLSAHRCRYSVNSCRR